MVWWLGLACYVSGADRDIAYDRDRDGQMSKQAGGTDCNDEDPDIYAGAFESCLDGVDSDCDGELCPLRTEMSLDSVDPYAVADVNLQYGSYSDVVDFTADGIDDVVVSVPGADGGRGAVMILPGPLDRDFEDAFKDAMIVFAQDYSELRLDAVLDINGDGSPELILTGTETQPFGRARNVHFLIPLFVTGEFAVEDFNERISGGEWEDAEVGDYLEDEADFDELFTGGVDNIGDQDLDGGEDLLVRAPYDGDGLVFLLTADLDNPDANGVRSSAEAVVRTSPGAGFEQLGDIGGRGPDINGDGIPEVIIGSTDYDLPIEASGLYYEDVGGIFLYEGPLVGIMTEKDAEFRISGAYTESPVSSATGIGDTNGDGYEELGVYVRSGGGDLAIFREFDPDDPLYLVQSADVYLYGSIADEITSEFGESMVSHDVDGDGRSDLILAAPTEPTLDGWDPLGLGAAYLFMGPVSGVQSPNHATAHWSAGSGDWLLAPPMVGDVDDDAAPDLLLPYVGDDEVGGNFYVLSDAFSGL